jgi:oligoribonuclease NrnB/cAMP/cGMP phosphodiesterase (DHH superfamily)
MSKSMVVIYHYPCNDGFCCAWLMHLAYGEKCEFKPWSHEESKVLKYEEYINKDVFILDFSFDEDTLVRLATVAKSVTVLDHHKTASHVKTLIEDGVIDGVFDLTKSGARLTLDYLKGQGHCYLETDLGDIVNYVQDADLYKWDLEDSRDVNSAINSYPRTFDAWDMFPAPWELAQEGKAVNRYRERLIASHVAQAKTGVINGYYKIREVQCTSPELVSDLGHQLAHDVDYAMIIMPMNGGIKYSMRSVEGGADVGEIAVKMGGGGHKHAASYFVPLD